jgi:putative YjhG/YagF family dehydratase
MSDDFFPTDESIYKIATRAAGPAGALPLTDELLRTSPSGDIFGLTQNVGMGWEPSLANDRSFLILSTQGGLRAPDGRPVALGYHTGHWEIGMLVEAAARELRTLGAVPFAAACSDPCDGRTQGTTGMFDSLPFRNDAAIVFRRLIRSLPRRRGVIGVATCDKGLPAMMMALAGARDLPCVLVPGGVTLPPSDGEDAGAVQTIGARYSRGLLSLKEAAELGCRACASPGGGCQFLGTAATSQVIAEALGLALPHTALAPSGQPVWREMAVRSARAIAHLDARGITSRHVITPAAIRNAMVVHAAFGGSTNLLLHIPAIAHAAGLPRPSVADWIDVNRRTPRLVDVLPNGPQFHPTVRAFLAGGVPEVMLHLRALGLLDCTALTATGAALSENLDAWERSERRMRFREILHAQDGVDADEVIMSPALARERGLTGTLVFPLGNLAPEGSVIKATAIDASVVGADGVYRHEGPARVFTSEAAAIAALREGRIAAGDVMVLCGIGPMGTGMEETYQVTSALKALPHGKRVALLTDARFSGVSTGACIGHIGPEALAAGPIGKVRDGDVIRIVIDRSAMTGNVDLIGENARVFSPEEGARVLAARTSRSDLAPHPALPDDTRIWAALQNASGGTWGGCVYDADAITALTEPRAPAPSGPGAPAPSEPSAPARPTSAPARVRTPPPSTEQFRAGTPAPGAQERLAPRNRHPIHLPPLEEHNRPIIIAVTVVTKMRQRVLATPGAHELLRTVWSQAAHWSVGRYVIMPDHVHFFCAPADQNGTLERWMTYWKSQLSKRWPERSQVPVFQTQHWDRQLRREESYDERWEYFRQNPVRAGLVVRADDWPFQGEIHQLLW